MGLEGLVVLRLRITSQGSLATPPSIERSSGYGVLDQEAVRMVSAALPLPILPTGFRRPWAEFRIPVRFALEN
ncbi:energy transducer TonB [Myxococcota bacterium]|nr:energy transducer TonB [Myxococcota bacterium]